MQNLMMVFHPFTGRWIMPGLFAVDAREHSPGKTWLFNPWTGARRTADEMRDDPEGVSIQDTDRVLRSSDLDALCRLAYDLLNPERHGQTVTREIRNQARQALGIDYVE